MLKHEGIIIIFICIALVFVSGCTNSPKQTLPLTTEPTTQPPTPVSTITTTITPTTITTSQTSQIVTSANPIITPTQKKVYSSNEINRHFLDVAFGTDYSFIFKWNKDRINIGVTGYTNSDLDILNDFLAQFNNHSSSTKISENLKLGSRMGDININFVDESALNVMKNDPAWKVAWDPNTGKIFYVYKVFTSAGVNENIYINNGLKGDERKHWIIRSLLYELGFPGESGVYPDSFFYTDYSANKTSLNSIDWKSVELMYGKMITFGTNMSQVRNVLFIQTN